MFDFLRDLTKSTEEKRQEALHAYLDDALSPRERRQFEQQLAQDPALQAELVQYRQLRQQLRQLPRRPVPHNFTLDPAKYGRPQKQPLFQLYPAMRAATVLAAFFFVLAIAVDLFLVQGGLPMAAPQQDVALVAEEPAAEEMSETAADEAVVEVTRIVTESVVESAEVAEEELMEEEEAVAENAAEEEEAAAAPAELSAPEAEAEEADVGESATAPADELTAAAAETPAPTPSPMPTPAAIPSPMPRLTEAAPDRAATAVAAEPPTGDTTESDIVPTLVAQTETAPEAGIGGLRWVQIILAALFLILAGATLFVRRQL